MDNLRQRVAALEREAAKADPEECQCDAWNRPGVGWRTVYEVEHADSEWARLQIAKSDPIEYCQACGKRRPVLCIAYGEWGHRPGESYG